MQGVKYKCQSCEREFVNYPFYALHSSQCGKEQNINFEDKPHEFPITDAAINTIKRVMDEQDNYGIKKYGTPLNWKDNYNWREMKLQELADFLKYEECEHLEKQEVIRILQGALTLEHADSLRKYIRFALEILTKTNTGK